MLTIRKADFYSQVILGCLMVLSMPFMFLHGFLLGLFFLGCWQMISAVLNTRAFIRSGFKKSVLTYWIWASFDLLVLLFCIPLSELFKPDDVRVIVAIAVFGSVVIAIYYGVIYKKLIDHLDFKNELSAFIKS